MAAGLAAAGLQRGQHLVVVGDNRPRLTMAMLAAQCLGAIPVPLYQDATGAEYVSVSLSAPEFGTIYGNIANAPGDDPSKKVIIWNPPS